MSARDRGDPAGVARLWHDRRALDLATLRRILVDVDGPTPSGSRGAPAGLVGMGRMLLPGADVRPVQEPF